MWSFQNKKSRGSYYYKERHYIIQDVEVIQNIELKMKQPPPSKLTIAEERKTYHGANRF